MGMWERLGVVIQRVPSLYCSWSYKNSARLLVLAQKSRARFLSVSQFLGSHYAHTRTVPYHIIPYRVIPYNVIHYNSYNNLPTVLHLPDHTRSYHTFYLSNIIMTQAPFFTKHKILILMIVVPMAYYTPWHIIPDTGNHTVFLRTVPYHTTHSTPL